jgi:hypothetical protein
LKLGGQEARNSNMQRAVLPIFGLSCFLGVLVILYRPVLFEDGQFAFRDAGLFYYPLYLRVQQEWSAGRWPLWNPGQNGGEPLLGNPMAAVLYPVKVLYAVLSYAWAARVYVIAHTVIAFFGLFALARTFGISAAGSCLGGLSYAFGGPVFCLYSNVIFLVGAAWLPWGLLAIDRMLRQEKRRGVCELAVILALMVLGGDPETAYLAAVCGAGYAVLLALHEHGRKRRPAIPMVVGAMCIWVLATLGLAAARITWPEPRITNWLVLAGWLTLGLVMAWRWYRHPAQTRMAPLLARLMAACALAVALAAAQVFPVAEFASQSQRADRITSTEMYAFSLSPCRLIELVWPNVFGSNAPEPRSWLQGVPPVGDHQLWVDSLYLGGLAVVLALSALAWRDAPPWRAWLSIVAMVGLAASFGKFCSPLWWARWLPLATTIGPRDPVRGDVRWDSFLGDGAGSPYALLSILLPGFSAFRYPSKLLVFTAVALTVLAGTGWDRVREGASDARRVRRIGLAGLGSSLLGLLLALATRDHVIAYFSDIVPFDSIFGPPDIEGAWAETERALVQGAIVFAAIVGLTQCALRRPRVAGAFALLLLATDLAVANKRLTRTVPQATFEVRSEVARLIEAAERTDPSSGPYRVHRMPGSWFPSRFATTRSDQRLRELISWARDTIYPLAALSIELDYCSTIGTVALDEYAEFFRPTMMSASAETERSLGIPAGRPVIYYPRRSFDVWGARYFVLPATPNMANTMRGIASFLDKTKLIYPSPDVLYSRRNPQVKEPWGEVQDWHLRQNKSVYPRAWIVHSARLHSPASTADSRTRLTDLITYMKDPIWNDGDRPIFDLRQTALIEVDDDVRLRRFISASPVTPSESVAVVKYEPQRVELRAMLDRPGLVVLADTYYPGWHLTIDNMAAPVYRANRLMRAAAVPAGEHTLVYKYDPASFRVGTLISLLGLIVLAALTLTTPRNPAAVPRLGA